METHVLRDVPHAIWKSLMKAGDLVRLCMVCYPQYDGKMGLIIGSHVCQPSSTPKRWWKVMINGKLHPYAISTSDMVLINATR